MLLQSPSISLMVLVLLSTSLVTLSLSDPIIDRSSNSNSDGGSTLYSQDHRHSAFCPRERSRVVRNFLNEHVYPLLSVEPTMLPPNCALNPSYDPYKDQEAHKEKQGRGEWRCLYCSKLFKNEHYLDKHLHNKHTDKLSNRSIGCLGHICPIFGCDSDDSATKISKIDVSNGNLGTSGAIKDFSNIKKSCNSENIEKLLFSCDLLMRRCFKGVANRNGADSYTYFKDKICNRLHCDAGILKGSIPDPVEDKNVGSLLKCLVIVLSIISIVGYIIFNNIIPNLLFDRSGRLQSNILSRRIEEKSKIRQQQSSGGGFWSYFFGRSIKKSH